VRGLFIHIVVYGVVNALLVGVWLVTTGSPLALTQVSTQVSTDPGLALRNGFWPLAVAAGWGGALVIHLGVWLSAVLFGGGRRRRIRREARRAALSPKPPELPASTTWTPVISVGQDLAQHATRAAIGLVESLASKAANRPAESQVPSGRHWVAVMFTDLVGSTDLAESLGDARWLKLLAAHRRLVRECVGANRGTEVGTQGDGFLVRFNSPDAAVACAVAIQRRSAASRRHEPLMPELRVGIHAGEAVADDNDLVGRVINLAARVNEAAEPGEILVTEPAADHLSPGVPLIDRGLRPLKGIGQPRHLLAVAWRE